VLVLFVVLKLAGAGDVADWSWWWVTSPLWGGIIGSVPLALTLVPYINRDRACKLQQLNELRATMGKPPVRWEDL
jgi:hypothetical protein